MPRPLRLDPPDGRHHVMNRGARHEAIFITDQDRLFFLDLLHRCTILFGLRVHAYALMDNHFHLLVSSPRGNLGEAMSFLQSRYTRRLNLVHDWDGPVWRGRYKNRLVEDDAYWRHLLAYVHLNPVEAHLVGRPDEAVWTSHRAYLGLERRPDWLDTHELLDLFGGVKVLAQYIYEVQVGRQSAPPGFDEERLWSPTLSVQVPEAPAETPLRSVESALAEVAAITGLDADAISRSTMGPGGNPARLLAMWWLREGAGLGTNAIARHFGVSAPAASRVLRRAAGRCGEEVEAWKEGLVDGREGREKC